MQPKSFGRYLVEQGLITEESYRIALQIQNKNRLLAEIAVEMLFLKPEDVPRIIAFAERNPSMKFGEAAVSLGLLNWHQLRYLLDIRTRRKTRIGDILVEHGFITREILLKALMSFEQHGRRLEKILIAETTNTISRIIESVLLKHGYRVFKAKNGADALKLALTAEPDIVIAGGQLEDMEGHQLCSRLVQSGLTARMILLSSDDSPGHIQQAFDAGINHFLKKPVTESELINLLYRMESEAAEKRPEKILVVDDSRGARKIITGELERAGFTVYTADNGAEGVATAKKMRPNIITLDIEMPGIDGFEACGLLKKESSTKDIPVIIISSKTSSELIDRGFDAGAVEYFTKPFKPGSLAAYIDIILESKKITRMGSILVVEDSPTTQHIIKYLFSKNGFSVHVTSDGGEALKALEGITPDLILTDCYMPGIDGFALTTEIRRRAELRHIPVIMLTSAESKDEMLRGLACGASDYILKPFDESELLARVNTHLVNKKLFDEIQYEREKLSRSNRVITGILNELSLLSDMGTRLQACRSMPETYEIIAGALRQLYPASAGELVIQQGPGQSYVAVSAWGPVEKRICKDFTPAQCSALKLGIEFAYEKDAGGKPCSNSAIFACSACICIPLHEQNGIFGMLHLEQFDDTRHTGDTSAGRTLDGDRWHILRTAAEHVRLALCNLRLQESLREQSIRDPLTKLYNRRNIYEFLEHEISRAQRMCRKLGLIMLDLDHFKEFNDRHGHTAGDGLLESVSSALSRMTRKMDMACRYGGEEFIVVLPEIERQHIMKRAERIRTEIEKSIRPDPAGTEGGPVTVSLGIATLPYNGAAAQQLIDAADAALYKAKNSGRNRSVLAE